MTKQNCSMCGEEVETVEGKGIVYCRDCVIKPSYRELEAEIKKLEERCRKNYWKKAFVAFKKGIENEIRVKQGETLNPTYKCPECKFEGKMKDFDYDAGACELSCRKCSVMGGREPETEHDMEKAIIQIKQLEGLLKIIEEI